MCVKPLFRSREMQCASTSACASTGILGTPSVCQNSPTICQKSPTRVLDACIMCQYQRLRFHRDIRHQGLGFRFWAVRCSYGDTDTDTDRYRHRRRHGHRLRNRHKNTHALTHARTHARTHAHTHTHIEREIERETDRTLQ